MIKRIKKRISLTECSRFSSPKRLQDIDEANRSNITTKSLPKQKCAALLPFAVIKQEGIRKVS